MDSENRGENSNQPDRSQVPQFVQTLHNLPQQPVFIEMIFPGLPTSLVDSVARIMELDTEPADGNWANLIAADGADVRVVDVWRSPIDFLVFYDTRLRAALVAAGYEGVPEVKVLTLHGLTLSGPHRYHEDEQSSDNYGGLFGELTGYGHWHGPIDFGALRPRRPMSYRPERPETEHETL